MGCGDNGPDKCEEVKTFHVDSGSYEYTYEEARPWPDGQALDEFSVEIDRDAERVTVRYRIDDKEVVETYKITGSNLEP
ncbi:hypothetical protein FRD01_18645 [Microvenator marinus]|uniref:Uncharacterized protein n=1 Tax=Microvenator marinus TaxID=2600177 RepID=A0A5B8XVM0_9DELT|nr:hypothetical protein [Microvenator marinus]QED29221.1 hypothetical protein FRD01_18645 [Microvenator marinus]